MSEDLSLFDRYLAGECTPAEEAELRRRFGDADPRAEIMRALQDRDDTARFDSVRAWNALREQMTVRYRAPKPWLSQGRMVRIAATIVFLVTGTVALPPIIARLVMQHGPPAGAALVEATGFGERRDVRLSDGTLVTIAPRSELRFPAHFGPGLRTVSLRGQAAFSVAHDQTRPFIVRASGLTVRVLGTEFDVRENGADSTTDVVVASGRVWLQTPTDSAGPILTARQLGHVNVASGRILVRRDVAVERYMGWRTGHVRVDKAPLRDVVAELSRWFDVDFVVSDSVLAARTVSADLRVGKDASLDVMLGALSLATDARYVREGRTVTLRRR